MKLPARVLSSLRAPLFAVAVAGCTTPLAVADVQPEETSRLGPIELSAAIDPVSYDAASESERYARLDQTLAANDDRRDQRVEDAERASRPVTAHHGALHRNQNHNANARHIYLPCGRG